MMMTMMMMIIIIITNDSYCGVMQLCSPMHPSVKVLRQKSCIYTYIYIIMSQS